MFDNRMIDVAIGLALVFAMTSLLVTALQEAWASALGLRGRNLKKAIISFVGDDKTFAEVLLAHPLLVSLSPQNTQSRRRKPSYVSADVVVSSLLSQVVDKYAGGIRPSSPAELASVLKAAVSKAAAAGGAPGAVPNAEFVQGLSSLALGVENDWPAYEARLCAWFDAVGDRSIGWFKRQTQVWLFLFGLAVAGTMNINPIVIAQRLWEDEALRKAMVTAADEASKTYAQSQNPVASQPVSVPPAPTAGSSGAPAQPGATKGTAVVKGGTGAPPPMSASVPSLVSPVRISESKAVEQNIAALNEALLTAIESLKKPGTQLTHSVEGVWQRANFAARELIALRTDIDQMREPDDGSILSLRRQAVANASIDRRLATIEGNLPAGDNEKIHEEVRKYAKALDLSITAERKALLNRHATRLRECEKVDEAVRNLCLRMNDLAALRGAGLPIGWGSDAWPRVNSAGCAKTDATDKPAATPDCLLADFGISDRMAAWLMALAGWLVTAIACMLGAPFWFDMLGKLVKLRGTGARADGGGPGGSPGGPSGPSPGGTLSRTPAPPAGDASAREPMSDALNEAERALARAEIVRVQRGLKLTDDKTSGTFDSVTRQAIKEWQGKRGHEATGELTANQIQDLLGFGPGSEDDGYLG